MLFAFYIHLVDTICNHFSSLYTHTHNILQLIQIFSVPFHQLNWRNNLRMNQFQRQKVGWLMQIHRTQLSTAILLHHCTALNYFHFFFHSSAEFIMHSLPRPSLHSNRPRLGINFNMHNSSNYTFNYGPSVIFIHASRCTVTVQWIYGMYRALLLHGPTRSWPAFNLVNFHYFFVTFNIRKIFTYISENFFFWQTFYFSFTNCVYMLRRIA